MKFLKARKKILAEVVQITKDNVKEISDYVKENSFSGIFEFDEEGVTIGSLENNGFRGKYGGYLCRELLPSGKCNFYIIDEGIFKENYEITSK